MTKAGPIVECVPNFSEGVSAAAVEQIVAAMAVSGVHLLDWSLDRDHNRSVVTIAGSPAEVVEAVVRAVGKARDLIDLTRQNGVHPRIGAADVVPFVPVRGITLAECAVLARQAGMQMWHRYGVPVYFYGAAATRPDRVQLEDVRRGQFEGLRDAVHRDSARRPDVGGPDLHRTAGASVVGARSFLVAYNVYLAAKEKTGHPVDIATARAIARDIRASSGGLHGVKAMGVTANGRSQISMNITDLQVTPMSRVFDRVKELADRHGAEVAEGELIGLVPAASIQEGEAWVANIPGFNAEQKILEQRLQRPLAWPGPR